MTDPNQTPASNEPTPSAYPQSTPPAYDKTPAPAYDKTPAPAYGAAPSAAPAYAAAPTAPSAYSAQGYAAPATQDKWNVLAIVSLVSAFFVSLAAVICGHIALGQIKTTGEKGRGLAIAGVVLGYLGLLAGLISLIVFIVFMVAIGNSDGYSSF